MTDEYSWWRDAVAEKRGVETERGSIRLGYYRRRNEAVAFYRDINHEGGDDPPGPVCCWRSSGGFTPTKFDEMEDLFAYCAPTPVSYSDFQFHQDNGRWPEQLEPIKPLVETALAPEKALEAEIVALREQAEAWVAGIGSIKSQAEADKAANYGEAFAALEKRGVDAHRIEKAPFLRGARTVDAKWNPLRERAAMLKTWAKTITLPFLQAEKKRIVERERALLEAERARQRELDAARVHAARIGAPRPPDPGPPLAAPPQKAGAGTAGRKVALRTRTVVEISDWHAFLIYLAGQNNLPDDFTMAAEKQAKRMVDAGLNPPGITLKEVEVAA